MDHFVRAQADPSTPPLRLIIQGTAGTGKSWLLPLLRRDLGMNAHFTAPTGRAACLIDGRTLHSVIGLPTGKGAHKMHKGKKDEVIERFSKNINHSATYIFVERSLVGSNMMQTIKRIS